MLTFDRQGLIPAVIVDDASGEVLMVAFMNQEALQRTRESGQTHFFSRSRNSIWRKGEQSGNTQEVCSIFVNCEENSLLIRVKQHGGAACHEGYKSCYYRQLLPDNTYQPVAERIFDPAIVYNAMQRDPENTMQDIHIANKLENGEQRSRLEASLRQLYGVYLYLRDHDLSEQSNTSRLLQEHSQSYLVSRLADELQELADVQNGGHMHSDRQSDTILEGSQVGYWMFLIAAGCSISYNNFQPHVALLDGYHRQYSEAQVMEERQECLNLVASEQPADVARGLQLGFAQIGWACAIAQVDPLAPAEYDLDQMGRKGLVK